MNRKTLFLALMPFLMLAGSIELPVMLRWNDNNNFKRLKEKWI